jgi:hypothetical protein
MFVFFAVIAGCLWLVAVGALCIATFDAFEYHGIGRGVTFAAFGLVLFAVPFGVASAMGDGRGDRLCLRGHQEWRESWRGPVVVGKVIVPGGRSTSKSWVCDQWEQ